MLDGYICKIATIEEMNKKWDYKISIATHDKGNWIIWKKDSIEKFQKRFIIPYYGLLNGEIICECTAEIDSSIVQNAENLVDEQTAYLSAFRTNKEYQGQGYFSKLFKFIIEDLKKRGYKKVTVGVEPKEEKNKAIYHKELSKNCENVIKRETYLLSENTKIKKYRGKYEGLCIADIEFESQEEFNSFQKPDWLGCEVTKTLLGKDGQIILLSSKQLFSMVNNLNRSSNEQDR